MNTQIANTYFKFSAWVVSKVSYTLLRQKRCYVYKKGKFPVVRYVLLKQLGGKKVLRSKLKKDWNGFKIQQDTKMLSVGSSMHVREGAPSQKPGNAHSIPRSAQGVQHTSCNSQEVKGRAFTSSWPPTHCNNLLANAASLPKIFARSFSLYSSFYHLVETSQSQTTYHSNSFYCILRRMHVSNKNP